MLEMFYLCDRKACKICSYPLCQHTSDPSHAINFDKGYGSGYFERTYTKPSVLGPNEYQREAEKYANQNLSNMDKLVEGLMGLNGEAGEAIDCIKKNLYQDHPLDTEHLAKELGDVAWYLAEAAGAIGYSLEDILQMNLEKLRKRYPDKFDSSRSINRNPDDT